MRPQDPAALAQRPDRVRHVLERLGVHEQVPGLVLERQGLQVDVGVLDELVAGEPFEPGRELPGAVDLEELVRRLGRHPVLERAVPADLGQERRREALRAQRVAAVRAAGALPAVDRLGLLRR